MMNNDNGRDVQEDDDNVVHQLIFDNDIPDSNVVNEQASSEPPIDSQLRRSTREHHPFQRYFFHEYVMITDEKESDCYQEAMNHEQKR